ncbi:hypothetical protein [Roseovarius amoyensis]|uniref:LIC10280 family protein n=1 Tax=Roseovarius amoyensis TaxID=2211448 RepID=UPI000DBE069A|nr:hypothetical protein [Roseovarius amoyensis]
MTDRRLFIAGALAAMATLATGAAAQQTPVYHIAGTYDARGMNPDGSVYRGAVQISQQGSAVEVYWNVASQSYTGRGQIEGRVVTVDWGSPTPVVYVLMGRELHGTWENGTALEKLTPR